MRFEFKTKTDINGNTYYLIIDTERKVYFENGSGGIVITKKDLRELRDKAKKEGYKQGIKIL